MSEASAKPNVIIITTHDSGRHFGCYGVSTVHTPAIDALAADGYLFTGMFTSSPVCSPSRGALLTGRYPQSNGLIGLVHSPWDWRLDAGEKHLAQLLREAGYRSCLFGFQHEGPDAAQLGFDEQYANQPLPRADEVARSFAEFLRSEDAKCKPFYAQVGFWETHRPWARHGDGPDDDKGVFVPPYLKESDATRQDLAGLQGVIRVVDDAVGIITEALAESGLEENTILLFTTDHGIEFPRAKWFCYEAGIEIAFILRWPGAGLTGGKTCDWLLSNVDFLPTLFVLLGLPVPENIEGIDFAGALKAKPAAASRDAVFGIFQGKEIRYVRTKRHKLIRNFAPRRWLETPVDVQAQEMKVKQPVVELYDLEADPLEVNNLAEDADHQAIRKELSGQLWSWMEQVSDPILTGPTPTPYYLEAIAEYRR